MMNVIRTILPVLFLIFLWSLFILNNLWRFLPEFAELQTFITVPLVVQILFFLIVTALVLLQLTRRSRFTQSVAICVFSTLGILSCYQVVLSNSMNSISIGIIPLFERKVRFADIKEIKFEPELRVVTNSDAYRIYTGVYPFGLDASSLKKQLLSYGNCTSEVDGECVDLQFAWP